MRYNTSQINMNFSAALIEENPEIITCGEFFAGGGGWTEGIHHIPGVKTKWILNHDKVALKTNAFHHKDVKIYWADIYAQDEHELEPVDYVHASVECTQHSLANGGKEKKIGSYVMGWELYRYLKFLQPLVISIENVPEFKKWAPLDEDGQPIKERKGEEFERWKKAITDLGYLYAESIRNAADDGLPTRRVRYFGVFYRPGIDFKFPKQTHCKHAKNGLKKHNACRPHLDLEDHGVSIFGREFNEQLPKHLRKKLSPKSLRRIGSGAIKYSPEFRNFIAHFYGSGKGPERHQSIDVPINTITTANRHQLVTMEKLQFIADHCQNDTWQKIDKPLNTQTTRQTKQIVSLICSYYNGSLVAQDLEMPLNTVTTKDRHQLVRIEKMQFISKYMSSSGKPEYNVQSIEEPLSSVMTVNKHQLVTILDDFDIKVRFLRPDELAGCSTFPRDYFNQEGLKLSTKDAVKMIGNAVPPQWAEVIIGPNIESMQAYKVTV